jgi:hypothetical protein
MTDKVFNFQRRPGSGAFSYAKRDPRAEVSIPCEIHQGFGPWRRHFVKNLSQSGCCIAYYREADITRPLRIRLSGLELQSATIIWQNGLNLGCVFDKPLHQAVLDHLIAYH